MKKHLAFIVLLLILAPGCRKSRCIKPAGTEDQSIVYLPSFTRCEITGDNYHLILYPDTSNYAVVRGGKNLISHVSFSVNEGSLIIDDRNRCRWMRSYKETLRIELHTAHLEYLLYRGAGNISTKDTLMQRSFSIESWDGSGSVQLLLHCDSVRLLSHTGPIDITAIGIAHYLYIYNNGNGFIYADNLINREAYIHNAGTGDTYIAPIQQTGYEIYFYGNIYCRTRPFILYKKEEGKGKFILQ